MADRPTSHEPPRTLLQAAGALAFLAGASGIVGVVATTVHAAWFAVGFEAMVALSGLMGAMVAFGRFRESPAAAILYVAGAIFVAAFWSWIGAGRALGGVSLTPLLMGRAVVCAALAAVSGVLTIGPGHVVWAFRRVALGAVLVAAPTAGLAVLTLSAPARAAIAALHPVPLAALGALAFIAAVGMLSSGAQLLIGTFFPSDDEQPASAPAQASPVRAPTPAPRSLEPTASATNPEQATILPPR